MSKDDKISFIKETIDKNDGEIKLSFEFKDSFGVVRQMERVYRGMVNNKPTKYYFVSSNHATSSIEIVSDECIEKLFKKMSEKFAD